MYFSLFMVVLRSLNTSRESIVSDARNGAGDGDGGQAAATFESSIYDARN